MSKRSIILAVAAIILFGLALFSVVMDKKVEPEQEPDPDKEPDKDLDKDPDPDKDPDKDPEPVKAKIEYKEPEPEQDVLLPDLGTAPNKAAKKKVIEQ